MTIEQIIDCDATKLEAMSDNELLKHFEPYLNITRPERSVKQRIQEQQIMQMNPKLKAGIDLAKSLGINVDISALTYKGRKK